MAKKLLSGNGWSFEPAGGGGAAAIVSLPDGEQRAKLRLEKRAGGRETTVVSGFVLSPGDRKALCSLLKKTCGGGGSATEAGIEVQGDHRDRIRALLAAKGWRVQ